MTLPQGAPKLNRHWLHASGGLIWHLRALRYRNNLWLPFRQTVQVWLEGWQPPTDKLLIIGPSAGYSLNAAFLQRWREVVALEPDPLARALLKRRYPSIAWRFVDLDVLNRHENLKLLGQHFAGYALLFANVLGQVAPRTESESHAWRKQLHDGLQAHYWASYHDVISTEHAPVKDATHANTLAPTSLENILEKFWQGGELALVDHGTFGLDLNNAGGRSYCVWPLRPSQYHLVEWLTGEPQK